MIARHDGRAPSKCAGKGPPATGTWRGTFRIESFASLNRHMTRRRNTHHRASRAWRRMNLA